MMGHFCTNPIFMLEGGLAPHPESDAWRKTRMTALDGFRDALASLPPGRVTQGERLIELLQMWNTVRQSRR